MKATRKAIILPVIAIVLILCLISLIPSCQYMQELRYYSQQDNFVSATGTISYIAYNKDRTQLYIAFTELSPKFSDNCFKIVGDNLLISRKREIDHKIAVGKQIEFISAPRYFGDGYVMPIVAITIDGEVLLEFEEGYTNLLKWLREQI